MSDIFTKRREYTTKRLEQFREKLKQHLGNDLDRIVGDKTTVYVTGSGGRGEMSDASDLDLFLVTKSGAPPKLDAVLLQSAIIRATSECGIEAPSADGVFLEMHSADDFERMLGSVEDDAKNKFTARMLLMLESRPVLGSDVYGAIVARMVDCYWSTAGDHAADFLPYAFVNDVIRYWRVVLLNHESRLRVKQDELRKEIGDLDELKRRMKTERYIRSVKLRFARSLTCFASMAFLLAKARSEKHVTKEMMLEMVALDPIARVHAAVDVANDQDTRKILDAMLNRYSRFLDETAYAKAVLRQRFEDPSYASGLAHEGSSFCDDMFKLLTKLGTNDSEPTPLYRYMLV